MPLAVLGVLARVEHEADTPLAYIPRIPRAPRTAKSSNTRSAGRDYERNLCFGDHRHSRGRTHSEISRLGHAPRCRFATPVDPRLPPRRSPRSSMPRGPGRVWKAGPGLHRSLGLGGPGVLGTRSVVGIFFFFRRRDHGLRGLMPVCATPLVLEGLLRELVGSPVRLAWDPNEVDAFELSDEFLELRVYSFRCGARTRYWPCI